jgi:hypothetical protein
VGLRQAQSERVLVVFAEASIPQPERYELV